MIRKLVTTLMLVCLGTTVVACGAGPTDDASKDALSSTSDALGLASKEKKGTAMLPRTTKEIVSNGGPVAACGCADHPKPGYNCNSCDMVTLTTGKTVCMCFYGLKSPTSHD